ncbi:148_t:CDS:2 [Funneliformis caledonium]|uniref:148_t:CDS:1 n=1 Tax=Funneliformis caledonium TaxID=1117310 RepID=A0A9N8YTE2_9GLOM|nr:148_t:CDS:2 [Funneliformis caledonium]
MIDSTKVMIHQFTTIWIIFGALYALTREIENGGLKQSNLESWYNCTQRLCRHQEANTATRNNRKRNATQKRSMKRRGDW